MIHARNITISITQVRGQMGKFRSKGWRTEMPLATTPLPGNAAGAWRGVSKDGNADTHLSSSLPPPVLRHTHTHTGGLVPLLSPEVQGSPGKVGTHESWTCGKRHRCCGDQGHSTGGLGQGTHRDVCCRILVGESTGWQSQLGSARGRARGAGSKACGQVRISTAVKTLTPPSWGAHSSPHSVSWEPIGKAQICGRPGWSPPAPGCSLAWPRSWAGALGQRGRAQRTSWCLPCK